MLRHWMTRIGCWLRLGHEWRYFYGGDERECPRCGLSQYAVWEYEDGEKDWQTE